MSWCRRRDNPGSSGEQGEGGERPSRRHEQFTSRCTISIHNFEHRGCIDHFGGPGSAARLACRPAPGAAICEVSETDPRIYTGGTIFDSYKLHLPRMSVMCGRSALPSSGFACTSSGSHQRQATRAQAAAHFVAPPYVVRGMSQMDPPRHLQTAADSCAWPRSCAWPQQPGQPAARAAGPLAAVAILLGLRPATAADDAVLPPDVEPLALFSDAPEVAAGEAEEGFWAKMWRYQGP